MKRNLQREEYVYAEYVCVYAWKFTLNKRVSQYNFVYILQVYARLYTQNTYTYTPEWAYEHIQQERKYISMYITGKRAIYG